MQSFSAQPPGLLELPAFVSVPTLSPRPLCIEGWGFLLHSSCCENGSSPSLKRSTPSVGFQETPQEGGSFCRIGGEGGPACAGKGTVGHRVREKAVCSGPGVAAGRRVGAGFSGARLPEVLRGLGRWGVYREHLEFTCC